MAGSFERDPEMTGSFLSGLRQSSVSVWTDRDVLVKPAALIRQA